ncbi:hypothetical protein EME01_54860 [Sinorhizobium meliloti]|nr:hypothetical protein EME01_54860 [Sinorhizobium meliloti]
MCRSRFATVGSMTGRARQASPPDPNGIMDESDILRIVATSTAGCTGKVKLRFHIPKVTGVYAFNQLDP